MATEPFLRATLSGEKELLALFDELPNALTEKVLQAAGVKALKPVADDARAIVARQSTDHGDLGQSITVGTRLSARQRKTFQRRGLVYAYAGPSGPSAATAHLVEFGTRDRFTKAHVFKGRVIPEPFMRPAWDANQHKVLATMRAELWNELVKAVRKLRKGADKGKVSRTIARQISARGS